MAGRSFPTTPDELTDAWLGEVTGVAGDWRLEPLTGGFWSSMVRAVADDGSSVVVKFADPSDQARFVCDLFDFNRVEVGFYRDLAADAPVRVPRPTHVAHTDDHAEYVIVVRASLPWTVSRKVIAQAAASWPIARFMSFSTKPLQKSSRSIKPATTKTG